MAAATSSSPRILLLERRGATSASRGRYPLSAVLSFARMVNEPPRRDNERCTRSVAGREITLQDYRVRECIHAYVRIGRAGQPASNSLAQTRRMHKYRDNH